MNAPQSRAALVATWITLGALSMASVFTGTLLTGCFQTEPLPPSSATIPVLHYRLGLQTHPKPAFTVSIDLQHWPSGSPKVFLAPTYETDNPDWPVPGLSPSEAIALNAQGDTLEFWVSPDPAYSPAGWPVSTNAGPSEAIGSRWYFPATTSQIRYRIDLDTLAPGRAGLAMPNLKPHHHMVDGANLFLIPVSGAQAWGMTTELASAQTWDPKQTFNPAWVWRSPVEVRLSCEAPAGYAQVGMARDIILPSPYALMFLRGVFAPTNRLRQRHVSVTLDGRTLPVTLYALTSDTVSLDVLAERMPDYIRSVKSLLGPLPTDFLAIGEAGTLGGLEGLHGYWFGKPYVSNHELHLHELIHLYVGIAIGDFDLPWFKEGVTTYLAQKLAVQMGYITPEAWQAAVLDIAADTTGPIISVSHGDVSARPHYFSSLDIDYLGGVEHGWQVLVYHKGLQTSLLLDAWLLQHSQGEHDLATLVRHLHTQAQVTRRAGFTRADFTHRMAALIEKAASEETALDPVALNPASLSAATLSAATAFAHQLFDTVGPINRDTLKAALNTVLAERPQQANLR